MGTVAGVVAIGEGVDAVDDEEVDVVDDAALDLDAAVLPPQAATSATATRGKAQRAMMLHLTTDMARLRATVGAKGVACHGLLVN
jgi:hypothetical protein